MRQASPRPCRTALALAAALAAGAAHAVGIDLGDKALGVARLDEADRKTGEVVRVAIHRYGFGLGIGQPGA